MAVLVPDLIADIRILSGLRNNQLFLDADIRELVLDAGNELYDDIEGSFQAYFVTVFNFTIATGGNSVALPVDFKRDNSLTLNPATSNPMRVDPLGSWLERDNASASFWTLGCDRKYWLNGTNLEIYPAANGAGNYRLFYTPFFVTASAGPTETIPVSMTPRALYLKVHASVAIRASRQQDTAALDQQLQGLKQRVAKSVKNRTQAPRQAPITRRARGNGWGGSW